MTVPNLQPGGLLPLHAVHARVDLHAVQSLVRQQV